MILSTVSYGFSARQVVLMPVCLLLGAKESWDEAKKLMADPTKFLESLKSYDKAPFQHISRLFWC